MSEKVVAVTLMARTAAYIAQMGAAAKATAGVGVAANAAAVGAQPMARNMRNAARATGLLNPKLLGPAGLVLGLMSTVKQAARFEDQFAMVRKTMQESEAVLDQVALNIRALARDLPITTGELNQIATVAGQLGIAANDVTDFTETMAHLSITTNLTAEGAAIDFARLSNIMGKPIDEVRELGNVVVHLGNNMAAQETEIVEFAKRISGVGTQMGMAEEEILALAAALPALGLRAEMGGTAITRIMVELNKAVTEGTEKLSLFASTAGMSADQFAEAWRANPADTLMAFTAGIGTLSDEGVDAFEVISDLDLSMIRTQDTALRLAGGTEVYARAMQLANEETENQTAIQVEMDKRLDTTIAQWGIFKNNVRDLALDMGGPLNDALKETLRLLNDLKDAADGDPTNLRWRFDRDNPDNFASPQHLGQNTPESRAYLEGLGYQDADIREFLGLPSQGDEAWSARLDAMAASALGTSGTLRGLNAETERWNALAAHHGVDGLTDGLGDIDEAARNALTSMERLNSVLNDFVRINLTAEGAAIATEQGFHDLNETLQKSIEATDGQAASLDRTTQAGRDNERAVINQANAILSEVEARHEQGQSLGEIMGLYQLQVDRLRDVMRAANMTEDEIESYIATLGLTPDEVLTAINANSDDAYQDVLDYIRLTGMVPTWITTTIRARVDRASLLDARNTVMATGQNQRIHTGGYIHPSGQLQRFHGGGMVDGLKSDEVPAILQTGEMVLSRHQVGQIGAAFANGQNRGGDGAAMRPIEVTVYGDVSPKTEFRARNLLRGEL